jgi:hypothetical protein
MMPEIETHHHAHKTGRPWIDLVVPLCALVISVVSVVLAMIDGQAMERMADANTRLVKASSWPFLEYSTGDVADGKPVVSLAIGNVGVGPARIESFEVYWRGRPMRSFAELLETCCGAKPGARMALESNLVNYRVLPARQDQTFLSMPRTADNAEVWRRLDDERMRIIPRICYCSVFDECWIADLGITTPVRQTAVARCPKPRVPYAR